MCFAPPPLSGEKSELAKFHAEKLIDRVTIAHAAAVVAAAHTVAAATVVVAAVAVAAGTI